MFICETASGVWNDIVCKWSDGDKRVILCGAFIDSRSRPGMTSISGLVTKHRIFRGISPIRPIRPRMSQNLRFGAFKEGYFPLSVV